MQTLRQNAAIPRLAFIVAARIHARTLRVSSLARAEPVSLPPASTLSASQDNVRRAPSTQKSAKKRSKSPPPSPKPEADNSSSVTRKKSPKHKPLITRGSNRPKTTRKSKGAPASCKKKPSQGQVASGSRFAPDGWRVDWGKDDLAPPPPTKRATKSRLRKEAVPAAASGPSSSGRALPPHHEPYVRCTEGYIADGATQGRNILQDVESPSEHKPVAQLAHGLDRVLFNPGVYWLRDPRSRIYNFTPWLESIPVVTDFAFERVTGFIKSSRDDDLWKIAKQHKRIFGGSTSSLTGLLSHCYFLISGDKEVDTSSLSRAFLHQPTNFTAGQRIPTSVVLNYKDGVWLIDSDKTEELADKNVLTWMGTMLEKFLTVPEGEFKTFLRSSPAVEDPDTRREAYRYAMSDRFVMRSQLDCFNPRLPGTGIFDIKTRGAVPIRLDILNYEENSGYLIKTLTGPLESFEKEYYDLIRSAFLKYSFQARIGNMDGVLVAYHNTARIFGFQYVSLQEMEERLYGSGNGAKVFNKCVLLLEKVLSDAVSIYGERSVKCTFETRESSEELNVWIEPVDWDEQVEAKLCPITELDIRVVNHLDGEEVKGARAVADDRRWVVHWTLTQSGLEEAEIRRRLGSAQDRQFRALSFPAGVATVEEMEKVWAKIDFGGKNNVEEMIAARKGLEAQSEAASTAGSADEPQPGALESLCNEATREMQRPTASEPSSSSMASSASYPFLSFREPSKDIQQLRQLALLGREETLREEAEGRQKVVWGSPDGSAQPRGDWDGVAFGSGTLPTPNERPESCDVSEAIVRVPVDGPVTDESTPKLDSHVKRNGGKGLP